MNKNTIHIKSAIPIYCFGLTWLLYSLIFNLYRTIDFVIVFVISILVYVLAEKVFKGKEIEREVPDFDKSGNKAVDELITKGQQMLKDLADIKGQIKSDSLKQDITVLSKIGGEIYEYIFQNPNLVSSLRKFSDYYFPETIKILKVYAEFENIETSSDNVNNTKTKIEASTKEMINVFKKQLDTLLYNKAFDVQADIKVLETLLDEEGL